jgi:hypothetical protein
MGGGPVAGGGSRVHVTTDARFTFCLRFILELDREFASHDARSWLLQSELLL